MSEWQKTQIKSLFASSLPGEWGKEGTPENGTPVLRSTNFRNDGSIDFSDIAYRTIEPARLTKRLVVYGTVLIEKSGGSPTQAAGRIVFCDRDFGGTASNFIEVVNIRKGFHPKYIAYLLLYLYQSGLVLKYQQQTTGIINFKLNQYIEEPVGLPSDELEQAKIAEILAAIDRVIERTEELIAKHERIKSGLTQALLTRGIDEHGNLRSESTHAFKDSQLGRIPQSWSQTSFGKVFAEYGGHVQTGPFGSQLHSYEYLAEGIPVVMPQDIILGSINTSDIARISNFKAKTLARHRMLPGDLIFARRGDLSKCAVAKPEYEGWLCGTGCLLMRLPSRALSPRWTTEIYRFHTTQRQVSIQAVGSTMPNLNTEILQSLIFARPTLEEQLRIEDKLSRMEDHEELMRGLLSKLGNLKTGLMHDLLTGRKRVTTLLEIE